MRHTRRLLVVFLFCFGMITAGLGADDQAAKIDQILGVFDKPGSPGCAVGAIAENVYLFCASEGLVTVVRANVDRAAVAKAFKLRPAQRITLAQSIGYPQK